MAEVQRMTVDEVVSYFLEGEGVDFLHESLAWVCQHLLETEVSELVGAARGERAPEERLTHTEMAIARGCGRRVPARSVPLVLSSRLALGCFARRRPCDRDAAM